MLWAIGNGNQVGQFDLLENVKKIGYWDLFNTTYRFSNLGSNLKLV